MLVWKMYESCNEWKSLYNRGIDMFKYLVLTLKGSTCEHKLRYDYINIEFPLKMCQLKLQTKGPFLSIKCNVNIWNTNNCHFSCIF